jgi:hypothetical protein
MSKLLALADVAHLSARKLPDAPDGRYSYQVQPEVTGAPDSASSSLHSRLTLVVDSVRSFVKQGPVVKDPEQVFVSPSYLSLRLIAEHISESVLASHSQSRCHRRQTGLLS